MTKEIIKEEYINLKERKKKEEIQSMKFNPKNIRYLIVNKELMEIAQKHAEMAKTNKFKHSIDKDRELKDHKMRMGWRKYISFIY